MKIFPVKKHYFTLHDTQAETLERLKRRTEKSESLTSNFTDKSFRGIIDRNTFQLISSKIGKGAFCVMKGTIETHTGYVTIEIHKVFRILLSIMFLFPPVGITIAILIDMEKFHPILIIVGIVQMFIIWFIFTRVVFKFLSKQSLQRLRDVLDVEWTNRNQ